jgi:hypothetical protein
MKSILIFIMLLCVAASCNYAEKSNTVRGSGNINHTAGMAVILKNDDCFDKKMELWFVRFHQFQDDGNHMHEANLKAIASVANEFEICEPSAAVMAEGDIPDEE